MPNAWSDYLAGTDELNVEEIMTRLQEAYRAPTGMSGWGRPYKLTDYDGLDPNLHVQALDTTQSLFALMETHDSAVKYQGDNDGHAFEGPFGFAGDGEINGNVTMVGDMDQTGDHNLVGSMDVTGTLHVTAGVDFDSTLNLDGAATFNGAVTLGNASGDAITVTGTATFAEDTTFTKAIIVNGNTTLGNAAGDTITATGTATFAEDVTMSKGLIVDTTTLVVDESANRVSVLTAAPNVAFEVAGRIRSSASEAIPTSGAAIEMTYTGGQSFIVSRDYSAGTYMPLNVFASTVSLAPGATAKILADTTGVRFYNAGAGVAKQTVDAAVSSAGVDATYGATEQNLLVALASSVNSIRTALINYGLAA